MYGSVWPVPAKTNSRTGGNLFAGDRNRKAHLLRLILHCCDDSSVRSLRPSARNRHGCQCAAPLAARLSEASDFLSAHATRAIGIRLPRFNHSIAGLISSDGGLKGDVGDAHTE